MPHTIREFVEDVPAVNRMANKPPVNMCCKDCQVAWHQVAGSRCWVCSAKGTLITGLNQWVTKSLTIPHVYPLA